MEPRLSVLSESSEYRELRAAAQSGGCAALSGLSPITRAHFLAAQYRDTGRPALVDCMFTQLLCRK